MPSHFPPGKTAQAPFERRLQWTRQTFENLSRVTVSDFESLSEKTLFGADIFRHFSAARPGAHFSWIVGDDQWEQLPYWNQIDTYASAITWVVLDRTQIKYKFPGLLSRRLSKSTCSYRLANSPLFEDISSSALRDHLANAPHEVSTLKWICKSIQDEVTEVYKKITTDQERRTH